MANPYILEEWSTSFENPLGPLTERHRIAKEAWIKKL